MKQIWTGLAAVALAVSMIGCGGGETAKTETTGGEAPATGKKLRVGIVFDSGGRGDKSFNDSAYAGIERAQKELGVEPKPVDSKSEKDYETNLTALAEGGCDMVVAVGINMETALKTVAPKFPTVKFAIVDGSVTGDNVRALKFKEEEGSFLAGYLAGLVSTTKKLGFIGGMEIPLIKRFQCGYEAGAKTADPSVVMLPAKYTGDWNNNDLAKTAATVLFTQGGADVVYHAAGRAGLGVIAAAGEQKKYAIGVDSDQDYLAEGFVLTSMIKRVDEAVFSTIKDLSESKFTAGERIYDLKENGVGLSEMKFTKDKIGADNLKKVDEIKAKVIAGELKVPATAEDLATYLATLKK